MNYWILTLLTLIAYTGNSQTITSSAISEKLLSLELLYWQSTSDVEKTELLLEKSAVYKTNENYKEAIKELERADKYELNDSITTVLSYEKLLNYFLSASYGYCNDIIIDVKQIERIGRKKEYTLMKLYALNELERWEECKQELIVLQNKDSSAIIHIQQLPVCYNYINPEDCKRLSSFLPGLGEVKAGFPIKGITSFVINAGLIVFTGYNFYGGYYFTGTVSGIMPFLKFYSGGKRLSQLLAEKHNKKEINSIKKQYSSIIQQTTIK